MKMCASKRWTEIYKNKSYSIIWLTSCFIYPDHSIDHSIFHNHEYESSCSPTFPQPCHCIVCVYHFLSHSKHHIGYIEYLRICLLTFTSYLETIPMYSTLCNYVHSFSTSQTAFMLFTSYLETIPMYSTLCNYVHSFSTSQTAFILFTSYLETIPMYSTLCNYVHSFSTSQTAFMLFTSYLEKNPYQCTILYALMYTVSLCTYFSDGICALFTNVLPYSVHVL